jgi:hypothetical protein
MLPNIVADDKIEIVLVVRKVKSVTYAKVNAWEVFVGVANRCQRAVNPRKLSLGEGLVNNIGKVPLSTTDVKDLGTLWTSR